jgi:hypothetical protein
MVTSWSSLPRSTQEQPRRRGSRLLDTTAAASPSVAPDPISAPAVAISGEAVLTPPPFDNACAKKQEGLIDLGNQGMLYPALVTRSSSGESISHCSISVSGPSSSGRSGVMSQPRRERTRSGAPSVETIARKPSHLTAPHARSGLENACAPGAVCARCVPDRPRAPCLCGVSSDCLSDARPGYAAWRAANHAARCGITLAAYAAIGRFVNETPELTQLRH